MLTDKQEKFVQGKLEGLNNMDAYRQAYNAENMSYEAIKVEASRLLSSPNVALTIKETKAAYRGWSLDKIVETLEENVYGAREDKQWSASTGAIVAIGKAIGVLTDKVDVNVTHTLKPGLSLEELEGRVRRLDALEGRIIEGEAIVLGDDNDNHDTEA